MGIVPRAGSNGKTGDGATENSDRIRHPPGVLQGRDPSVKSMWGMGRDIEGRELGQC